MRDEIRTEGRSQAAILADELQASIRQVESAAQAKPLYGSYGEAFGEKMGVKEQKNPRSRSRTSVRKRGKATGKRGQDTFQQGHAGGASFREREPGKSFSWKPAVGIFMALAVAASGFYMYKVVSFQKAYLPHTVINGMDVTGKTADEVKELIAAGVKDYELSLLLRGNGRETIKGTDIGLYTVFDGSLEEIIRQQNPYAWPRYLLKGPSYELKTMISFDEEGLSKTLSKLDCFDSSLAEAPRDACLSDYISGQGYTIVPETEGNQLDEAKVKEAVSRGVMKLAPELDLEVLGCYRTAAIRADNPALAAARDARNGYVNMTVTYIFGNKTQVLDGERIHQWLVGNGDTVTLNGEMIADYVKELAREYNTAYTTRSFKTSYGNTIEVSGFYGWRINQAAEVQELIRILESGESVTREPIYSQTAASRDGPDYGNTYAEVNLTAQHMFVYKEGELILESDFVSGNASKGYTTPPGLFGLTYKQRDAVLKGENYRSPVKFWMPFNGGIGFHDASWRSSFGGSIYKNNGSHGCINLPYAAAKTLFENVYAGMPVICYNLPGTENSKSSQESGKAPAASTAAPAASTAAPAAPTAAPAAPTAAPAASTAAVSSPVPPPASPPAQTQPEVFIQPVDKTTAAYEKENQTAGTTAGYGPGFTASASGEEAGPGVQ
ncbi:L,D-transpeptidase family protein [Clostridium porci]|uniref:L,D-transpeptidase family protein n=1 Tax=Clostridium porci TaxID=2605778 RepID=UPI003A92BC89